MLLLYPSAFFAANFTQRDIPREIVELTQQQQQREKIPTIRLGFWIKVGFSSNLGVSLYN